MQTVHLGVTQSGILGLFTGGFMASSIPANVECNVESLRAYCARMEFQLDEARTQAFIRKTWI